MVNNHPPRSADSPFANMPPPMAATSPAPKRAPEGDPLKKPRHVLRPIEEYEEYEEESHLRIPQSEWPDGFALQWVTISVWNQPQPQNRSRFERQGWVSVHQDDFDGKFRGRFMPASYEGEITYDGLVLMARSRAWSEKARKLDEGRARQRVQIKEQQLRMGDLGGVTLDAGHRSAVASNIVNRSVETIAMPVPEK